MVETKGQFKARAQALEPAVIAEQLEHKQERRAWREARRTRLGYGTGKQVVNESR